MLTVPVLAFTLPGCSCAVDSSEVVTEGARSVAELLSKPIYDTEVITYGKVSSLDESPTPYFKLTSGEETIRVWYDSMVDKDGTQNPRVGLGGGQEWSQGGHSGRAKRGSREVSRKR